MKKTLSIVIIIILSIGLVAPKLVGNQFSTTLNVIAEKMNNTPGYTVEIQTINSHWFSTDALVTLSLDTTHLTGLSDPALSDDYSVVFEVNAQHGPFLFNEKSNLAWLSWTANVDGETLRKNLDWSDNTDFFRANGLIDLLGDYDYQDTVTAFTANITDNNVNLMFSGYQGNGQYNGQDLTYQGNVAKLTATSNEGDFSMNNFTVDMLVNASLEEIFNNNFYDSATTVNFSSINFNNNESEIINLTDLYVSASLLLNKAEQLGNIQVAYGVKAADVNDYQVQDLALELAINNISGQFIKAYQDFSQTLGNTSAENMQEKMFNFTQENLLLLLSAGPEINITSLRGTFPEGKMNGTMHSSLVNVSALPTPIEDQQFWFSHALINGKITGDKAVIELFAKQFMKKQLQTTPQTQDMTTEEIDKMAAQQVPQMLNMLVEQGLLVVTDTHYTTDYILKDSQFKVNEKLIPLPF